MSECVVVGCDRAGVDVATKQTPWGAWQYWVCQTHLDEVADGAEINDNPDGTTITLTTANAKTGAGAQPQTDTAAAEEPLEELSAVDGNPQTTVSAPTPTGPVAEGRP